MNYEESLKYLDSLGKFGIRLGMERIQALLEELGNPEQKIKTIHVTGTNGKGSVASMIANILLASGLNVGKFTSPHFVRYNERIEINGKEIDDSTFAMAHTAVAVAVDAVMKKGIAQPTQFEVLTAAGFLVFALEHVDYAVIEVGLGGLWDSTNVIKPEVAVITNVSLDHMDRCGNTVEEIAMQKAGIIKEKVPVVTAATDKALGPITAMSMFKQAPLYIFGREFTGQEVTSTMEGQTFTLSAGEYHSNYSIVLPGAHQIANTAVAIVAAKIVSKNDAHITEQALHEGVTNTIWPGRLERIEKAPDVILDGAHNPAGAKALRAALDKYYAGQPVHFVFGMMGDKAMNEVAVALFRQGDKVNTVLADKGPRAASAQQLAEIVGDKAIAYESIEEAYKEAREAAGKRGIVCICGSLYLLGTFKAMAQKG
ncbi:MAG: bifunctional folylpolyglutamate synthase/dihydrofolate synthase [Acidaminococcaceae bacterium]|nr:bifunctional folylpolyglutamate synthase/dihydrofolate synthase [Acidaminococcaceae bacterium]